MDMREGEGRKEGGEMSEGYRRIAIRATRVEGDGENLG